MANPDPRHQTQRPETRLGARGALGNATGRYDPQSREAVDDGWDIEEEPRALETETREERPRILKLQNPIFLKKKLSKKCKKEKPTLL